MAFLRGTVDRVDPPNEHGWAKIYVTAEGHDRPVRIDTNRQEQMREALELRDARAFIALEYDEKSKYDERTGRSYLNRYWIRAARTGIQGNGSPQQQPMAFGGEQISVGREAVLSTPSFDAPKPEVGRPTNPRDAWRMSLAKSVELAIRSLPYLPVEQRTPGNQREIALFWAKFIYWTEIQPDEYSAASTPSMDPAWPAAGEQAPWPGDSDIPF